MTLHLCRFYPPHQIVGKARKRPFEGLAAFAHRRTIGREGLPNGANGNCARNHHHPHLGERAVPSGCGPGARQTSRRIAHARRGAPEPFLQKMIRQVFQPGRDTPVIFAGDEYETIRISNLPGQLIKPLGGLSRRIFLVHSVEHRKVDRLGVDEFDGCASPPQPLGDLTRYGLLAALGVAVFLCLNFLPSFNYLYAMRGWNVLQSYLYIGALMLMGWLMSLARSKDETTLG